MGRGQARSGHTSNQSFTDAAARNPSATALVLDRFACDRFRGVQVTVVQHRNVSRETLLRLVADGPKSRGVVSSKARKRLENDGVLFGDEGFTIDV